MNILIILAIFFTIFGTACLVAGTLESLANRGQRAPGDGGPRSRKTPSGQ